MVKERNIVLCIVLTIVTCGIYGLYWFVCLTDDTNTLAGDTKCASGGMALLFTLITCGIYSWYWMYKVGEKVDKIKGTSGSTGILYLVLGIFGLGIVSYCLAQSAINDKVAGQM